MLEIYIGGQKAALSEKTVITLNYKSSLFGFGKFSGTYSTSFTLPPCGHNRKLFGWPDVLAVSFSPKEHSCGLLFDGVLLETGTLVLKGASEKGYSCHITIGEGTFAAKIKDSYLDGINWGRKAFDSTRTRPYSPATDSYSLCPVRNRKFHSGKDRAHYQNRYRPSTGRYLTSADDVQTTAPDSFENRLFPVTPFPYVSHLLKGVFGRHGYHLKGNPLSQGELNGLVLYSNYDIAEYKRYVMDYKTADPKDKGTKEEYYQRETLSEFEYADIVPHVQVGTFLLSLFNYFALSVKFEGGTASIVRMADLLGADVKSEIPLKGIRVGTEPYTGYRLEIGKRSDIYNSGLPASSNYLGAYAGGLPKMDKGDAVFLEGPVHYCHFVKEKYPVAYSALQDFSYGNGKRELKVKIPLSLPGVEVINGNDEITVGHSHQEILGGNFYIGFKGMEGRGKNYNNDKKNGELILFHSDTETFGGRSRNHARVSAVNLENKFVYDHGLALPGARGIFANYHHTVAIWATGHRKEFGAEFYPDTAFLSQFRPWDKYSHKGTNFFITEMQVSIGMHAISKATIKAVTAP